MRKFAYRYRVEKEIYPYGPKEPVMQQFEIVIRAGTERGAEIQAANIGLALGVLLVGPS